MKRFFSLVVLSAVATFLLSSGITAFAIGTEGASQEIKVMIEKGITEPDSVYSVTVDFDNDGVFVYRQASAGRWNPNTHTYEGKCEPGWENNTTTITVTNHSNVAVNVSVRYDAQSNIGVTGSIENGEGTLAAVEEGGIAPSMQAMLTISGTPDESFEGGTVGTVCVDIV